MKKTYIVLAIVLSVLFINSAIAEKAIGVVYKDSLATISKIEFLKLKEHLSKTDRNAISKMKEDKKLFIINAGVLVDVRDVDVDNRVIEVVPLGMDDALWIFPYTVRLDNTDFEIFFQAR